MERKAFQDAERKLQESLEKIPKLRYQRVWERELGKQVGKRRARELVTAVQFRYEKLYIDRPKYSHAALHMHMVRYLLPSLALYLVLRESGYDKEEALKLTGHMLQAGMQSSRKWMAFFGRFRFFFPLTRTTARRFMHGNFPQEGFDIEWVETSAKMVAFNIHGCFYLDVYRRYDVPELTRVICGLDDYIYENVSPHVRWARTQTIARGGAHCDFRFVNSAMEDPPAVG